MQECQDVLNRKFNLVDLNPFLVCSLCAGYFRFAHTISECGHTYCFECLKAQQPKVCPQCSIPLSSTMIKKDPFKQNIVDLLYPQFCEEDQKVIKKLKHLFPETVDETSIQELMEEKQYIYPRRKRVKQELTQQQQSFQHTLQDTLGIGLDEFKKDIYNDSKFELYKKKIREKKEKQNRDLQDQQMKIQQQIYLQQKNRVKEPVQKKAQHNNEKDQTKQEDDKNYCAIINLQPSSDGDRLLNYEQQILLIRKIAQVNCQLKFKNNNTDIPLKLKKFIFKNIPQELCLKNNLVVKEKMSIENIALSHKNRILTNEDQLQNLYNAKGEIDIVYQIKFKQV